MAIDFRVAPVDFSGIGQSIAQGLQQAAQFRMQQEAIVRREIDDFKSTYDTGKMMPKDIPLFATAFDEYRKKAIEFNKLNRGGANTEKISAKQAELDAVRGKLNKVYTDSAKGASVLGDMVKYADRMTNSGYALPDDMNQTMMLLKTKPIDQINFDEIKAPTAYNFKANERDFTTLDGALKGIKENKGSVDVPGKSFDIEIGTKGEKGYQVVSVPEKEQFTIKDQYAVLGRVTDALNADALIKNAAVDQKAALQASLGSTATDTDSLIAKQLAKKTADKILTAYPELEGDITKASPAMVIAANRGYLDRNTLGTSVSMKEFNAKLAALKLNMNDKATQARLKMARDKILGKNSGANASTLRLILETGGNLYSTEDLEDMGITQDMIDKARRSYIQLAAEKGYRPSFIPQ
jgi:hypothetical protein